MFDEFLVDLGNRVYRCSRALFCLMQHVLYDRVKERKSGV